MLENNHSLMNCKEFLAKAPAERNAFVFDNESCFNCLSKGHMLNDGNSDVRRREGGLGHWCLGGGLGYWHISFKKRCLSTQYGFLRRQSMHRIYAATVSTCAYSQYTEDTSQP